MLQEIEKCFAEPNILERLEQLPTETLAEIFAFFTYAELKSVQLASKKGRQIVKRALTYGESGGSDFTKWHRYVYHNPLLKSIKKSETQEIFDSLSQAGPNANHNRRETCIMFRKWLKTQGKKLGIFSNRNKPILTSMLHFNYIRSLIIEIFEQQDVVFFDMENDVEQVRVITQEKRNILFANSEQYLHILLRDAIIIIQFFRPHFFVNIDVHSCPINILAIEFLQSALALTLERKKINNGLAVIYLSVVQLFIFFHSKFTFPMSLYLKVQEYDVLKELGLNTITSPHELIFQIRRLIMMLIEPTLELYPLIDDLASL